MSSCVTCRSRKFVTRLLAIGVALSLFYAVVYLMCGAWVSIHYHDSRLIWISVVRRDRPPSNEIYSFQPQGYLAI